MCGGGLPSTDDDGDIGELDFILLMVVTDDMMAMLMMMVMHVLHMNDGESICVQTRHEFMGIKCSMATLPSPPREPREEEGWNANLEIAKEFL